MPSGPTRQKNIPNRLSAIRGFFLGCVIAILLPTGSLLASPQQPESTGVAVRDGSVKSPDMNGAGATPAGRSSASKPSDTAVLFEKTISHEGIAVSFSMASAHLQERPSGELQEGDDVIFRFKIGDMATGAPLTSVYPAAWMDRRPEGEIIDGQTCVKKAEMFIGGTIFSAPELDLNTYYVVTLNLDPTLSVVDPLFGFGGTRLLALVPLQSPGDDWVVTEDQARIFISMPDSHRVAVVETASWQVVANLDAGLHPSRLALQSDEHYLWVVSDWRVNVISTADLKTVTQIPIGAGPHDIALSSDNRFAYVTNLNAGTVSIIDVRRLEKIRDLPTGLGPTSIAYSPIARTVYATHMGDGTIVGIADDRHEIVARMQAESGLGQIKFAPDGRFGFAVNPEKDVVHILDASTNRLVQTVDLEDGPDQVSFSDELAYIRHRGSENVLMIPLGEVGVEGQSVPVVDFPGGQHPPGQMTRSSSADAIVQAPGKSAVLIANPKDKAIYFYKEGMAAPMGNFSNYNREPRAVLVVDRSLQQRSVPGVYETAAKLRRPGFYDVVFFMDAPRIVHCFQVSVGENPELEALRRNARGVDIEPLLADRTVKVGESVRLKFRLTDPSMKTPKTGLKDVNVLTYLAPGIWHKRQRAQQAGEGIYAIDWVPPQPGIYYVYLECRSVGLTFSNPQYLVLEAMEDHQND